MMRIASCMLTVYLYGQNNVSNWLAQIDEIYCISLDIWRLLLALCASYFIDCKLRKKLCEGILWAKFAWKMASKAVYILLVAIALMSLCPVSNFSVFTL